MAAIGDTCRVPRPSPADLSIVDRAGFLDVTPCPAVLAPAESDPETCLECDQDRRRHAAFRRTVPRTSSMDAAESGRRPSAARPELGSGRCRPRGCRDPGTTDGAQDGRRIGRAGVRRLGPESRAQSLESSPNVEDPIEARPGGRDAAPGRDGHPWCGRPCAGSTSPASSMNPPTPCDQRVSVCAVKRFRISRGNHAPRQLGRSSRKLSERRWR